MLTVGSLFSGIGGIDLGLERAGMRVIWQAEIDPYASKVLARHWPDVPNLGDVNTIDWSSVERPDLIAGGFPCQPVSQAGRKQAQGDDRWLWPGFARAVRDLRPRLVLVENVPGLLVRGIDGVLGTLASLGYDSEWDCLRATAIGAPHVRRRLFITATLADTEGQPERPRLRESSPEGLWRGRFGHGSGPDRIEPCKECGEDWCHWHLAHRDDCGCTDPWDEFDDPDFGWWAAEPDVGRMAYGIPDRVDRMRGLGNAVVPQLAELVGRMILGADACHCACHAVIQPGLVPCPRCDQEADHSSRTVRD